MNLEEKEELGERRGREESENRPEGLHQISDQSVLE
jgi:hypothetical protein